MPSKADRVMSLCGTIGKVSWSMQGLLKWCCRTLTGCILLLTCVMPCRAEDDAASLDPTGKFLDVLATNGLPSLYGEVLGYLQEQGAVEFTKMATLYTQGGKLGVTGQMLTTAAAQKEIRDRIAFWNQTLGRAAAGVDFTGKLATGEYREAAISGAMTAISELAGTEGGKAVLQSLGISPPFVSATLLTYTVWRESSKAAADAEAGRMLESLYGGIENMARSRGRTLGQGDPFPATQENVEKVWRRILNDSDFRERFKVYVTQELQQEFPEAGFFDWAASHVGGAAVDDVTRQRLQEQERWVRQYVIGLINWLNRAAKAQEQEVLLRQQLAAAALKIKMNGGSLEKAMAQFDGAVGQLGVVNAYLNSAPRDIQTAIEKDDYETLLAHLKLVPDYVRNVVAWLPVKGPLSDVRGQYLAALKERYRMAAEGINGIRLKLKKRIETPRIALPAPPAAQGGAETPPAAESAPAAGAVDAAGMYRQHLSPVITPFDWGGTGDAERVKPTYERYLAEGKFTQAGLVEQAWRQQNFRLAMGGVEGVQTLPAPAENETFEGYRRRLLRDIGAVPEPAEIVSLRQSLQTQGEAIDKLWLDGNCMVFPGSFRCGDRPRPPADETREQRIARQERGQAIMGQAREMSDALTPSRQRLAQLQAAWVEAGNLARQVIEDRVMMARVRQDELVAWMNAVRQTHEDRARLARDGLERFRTAVAALGLPPDGDLPAEEQLTQLEALAAEQSYAGFGTFSPPREDAMLEALEQELSSRASRLLNDAANYYRQGETLQGAVLSAADGYRNAAETFPSLLQEVTPLVDDIVLFVEPRFREELASLSSRAERAKSLAGRLAARGARAGAAIATDRENREADVHYLLQLSRNLRSFRERATTLGVLAAGGGGQPSLPSQREYDTLPLMHPYPHYLTAGERDRIVAELREFWNASRLASFSATAAPWLNGAVDRYLEELARIPTFPEDNFRIGYDGGLSVSPVTVSALARAKVLLASMVPGEESFEAGFREIRTVLPLEILFYGGRTGTFATLMKGGWESTPLGKEYLAFRNQLKEQYALHLVRWEERQKREQQQLARELVGKMPGWLGSLRQRLGEGERLISRSESLTAGDRPGLEAALRELTQFHDHLTDDPYRQAMDGATVIFSVLGPEEPAGKEAMQVGQMIGQLSGRLHQARERLLGLISSGPQLDLAAFYETFRKAYESRNESALMALLGDDWEAGDGTTLADLAGYLRNSFSVFDEIRYTQGNLQILPSPQGVWRVTYDLTITGRIYAENLTHEEKSTVAEELAFDSGGKLRIVRTTGGRFWSVR